MKCTITVRIGRDTIDPQGLASDAENARVEKGILDAVRTITRGAFVRLDATGEVGRIGNRGSRGWWFGDADDSGWYVHASDVTPLEGEELRAAETAFAARRAVAMG